MIEYWAFFYQVFLKLCVERKNFNRFLCCFITIGENNHENLSDFIRYSYVVMSRYRAPAPFPIFPLPSLLYLPTFHWFSTFPFPAFPFPIYPTFLNFPFYFPSLYSSFPLNLPLSLSTFPFPSQSSPFPLNLPLSLSTFPFPSHPSTLPLNLPLYLSTFPFP